MNANGGEGDVKRGQDIKKKKSKETHRKPRDYLKGQLLEIQGKKCAKDQKYQALKTSKVKESATMKGTLQIKHWNESPRIPNGKAHKTQQLNNVQQ